jgi:PHD/YefM family antitoxin component YafN of YafNO toxin-antitoxin module
MEWATSTDIKNGWASVVARAVSRSMLAIRRNNKAQVVVVEARTWEALVREVAQLRRLANPSLDSLESDFAKRIALMREPAVADQVREMFSKPADLQGKVRVGSGR